MKQLTTERIITIRDYLIKIVGCWKWVLLSMIGFALLLGGFKYYKDWKFVKQWQAEQENGVESVSEDSELTEEELQTVSVAVKNYEEIQNLNQYMNNSMLMSYDADKMPYSKLAYTIELVGDDLEQYSEEDKSALYCRVAMLYSSYIQGSFVKDVIASGYDLPEEYFSELLDFQSNGQSIDLIVYGDHTKDACMEIIQSVMDNYSQGIDNSELSHQLCLVDSVNSTMVASDVFNRKQTCLSTLATLNSRLNSTVTAFSDNQLAYYNMLLGLAEEEVEDVIIEDAKPNFKYILLGLIGGFIVACGLIYLQMMLSGKVVTDLDYEVMFGMKQFGIVLCDDKSEKDMSALNKWKYGRLVEKNYEENMEYIARKIKLACDMVSKKKVALLSSMLDNMPENVINDLCNKLGKAGIEVVVLNGVLQSSEQLECLFETGCCVLVESVGISSVQVLQEIVELCREHNTSMLGVVDIQ